jgi:phage nucleotide-binding protein
MINDLSSRLITPETAVQNQGAKILVYGISGAGKTSLAKTAPGKVLVISAEAGLLSIKDASNIKIIEVTEAAELMQILKLLESGEWDFDTVCLDSISEISELLLQQEKARHKDPRKAYGEVQESVTNVLRAYRDLKMHVMFICKQERVNNDGALLFEPKMVGAKLGQSIPYFFDEVLALRVIDQQDQEGNTVKTRWLQTDDGAGYTAKDRSGKLNDFEPADLTKLIEKLGFSAVAENTDNVKEIANV